MLKMRVLCPYWTFPEIDVAPEHLQECTERVAFDENLPPKCSIEIRLDYLYEGTNIRPAPLVIPIDERLRTFLSYQPQLGAAFVNKLLEWSKHDVHEEAYVEIEDEDDDSDLLLY